MRADDTQYDDPLRDTMLPTEEARAAGGSHPLARSSVPPGGSRVPSMAGASSGGAGISVRPSTGVRRRRAISHDINAA
jgi:hypothetical protein